MAQQPLAALSPQMKALLGFLIFFAGFAQPREVARAGELRAEHCVITGLHITDGLLQVSFTGRWIVPERSTFVVADTDKNGFVLLQGETADLGAWKALCEAARHAFEQHSVVTIVTTTDRHHLTTRGGVPYFGMPPDQFTIRVVNSP